MKQHAGRQGSILGSLFVLVVLAFSMTGTPAQATTLINCTGEVELHYSPGLTNQTQTVTLTGEDRATLCVSLTHPTLRSFVGPYTSTGQLSCASLTSAAQGTETIYWNGTTNLTSAWSWTYSGVSVGGSIIATATGPITSGIAAGSTLTQVVITPVTALAACSQPGGLQTQTATSTWAFSN
jgi:hypothetical protein